MRIAPRFAMPAAVLVAGLASAIAVSVSATTASAATWTLPPVNAKWDYQIGGAYKPPAGVNVVDRDRTASPVPGLYNICYVNAYQTQSDDVQAGFWDTRKSLLLPKPAYINGGIPSSAKPSVQADAKKYWVIDGGWNEIVLNTRTAATRQGLTTVMTDWFVGCKNKGFQAIEPDNLDSFDRNAQTRQLLTRANNLTYAAMLSAAAHANGLAIAQKNLAGTTAAEVTKAGWDFAIAEECSAFRECGDYTARYGELVLEVEYNDNGTGSMNWACTNFRSLDPIMRDRDVTAPGSGSYYRKTC